MKYAATLLLPLLLGGCGQRKTATRISHLPSPTATQSVKDDANYTAIRAQRAWYVPGTSDSEPAATHYKQQFAIIADTNLIARDFISAWESNLRRCAARTDTAYVRRDEAWHKLTAQQKQARAVHEHAACGRQADSLHTVINHNREHFQLWLVNNSTDTIQLARQDDSFICVLQAQSKNNRWYSVQYWQFSGCGNSYYNQLLLPRERVALLATLPKRGPDKIKLRYKLAGINRFYYSNEFESRVDYAGFLQNNSCYKRAINGDSAAADLLGSLSRSSKGYWMTTTIPQLFGDWSRSLPY